MKGAQDRYGIASGGNWVVDRVKTVDHLPGRGLLANILAQESGTGGAPVNVLVDLSRMGAPFPLTGVGVVGEDEDGAFLLERCRAHNIDVQHLVTTSQAATSFTDVMSEQGSGERTFFHHRGANALFAPGHVPVAALSCRIFHLGYLLLLDRMDVPDPDYGTVAARCLHELQQAGIRTSLDVVSEDSDRFRSLVPPALQFADYLIVNEIEAGRTVGREVRGPDDRLDGAALADAVEELHGLGSMELVAVHMPEGVYMRDRAGKQFACGSLVLPEGYIRGAVGAGDACCAGILFGIHEGWDLADAARLGVCAAAGCLSSPNTTDGVRAADELLALAAEFGQRDAPVTC